MIGYTYSYGEGNADAYLVRTNDDGDMLWNKTFGGANYDYGLDIVELVDGYIITGYTNSYSASYDLWLIRTDLSGDEIWSVTHGGSVSDYGREVVACSGGGFTVAGYTDSYGEGNHDMWLLHTDAVGNHLWNETYGGTNSEQGYDLVELSGSGYALVGYTISFGAGSADAWLVRTDTTGNHLWNETYGTTSADYGYSLIECSGGGYAISGRTSSYGAIDGAAWLVRTDASGNHQWNETYDFPETDGADAVIECSDGGFALAGYSEPVLPLNSRASQRISIYDALVVRTDSTGNMQWYNIFGESPNDQFKALVESGNGDLVIAGYTQSYGAGVSDGWLMKIRYPLVWDPAPTDQTLAYGVPLAYDLNASSFFALATWTLNDTTNFAISAAGIVSNALMLAVGNYGLQVTVTDVGGSEISSEFTVTVEAPLISPIHPILIAVAAVIIIVVIILLLYFFVFRKKK